MHPCVFRFVLVRSISTNIHNNDVYRLSNSINFVFSRKSLQKKKKNANNQHTFSYVCMFVWHSASGIFFLSMEGGFKITVSVRI